MKQPDGDKKPQPKRFTGITPVNKQPKKSKIAELIEFANSDITNSRRDINFGNISNQLAQQIKLEHKIHVHGALKILSSFQVKHILEGHSDEVEKAQGRGQKGVVENDFNLIPIIFLNPDSVERGYKWREKLVLKFIKTIKNYTYILVTAFSIKQNTIEVITFYIK